jgi:hypothetical protein
MSPVLKQVAISVALICGFSMAANAQQQISTKDLPAFWVAKSPIAPDYLVTAARYGLEGCYLVAFEVDATGHVASAEIVHAEVDFVGLAGLGTKLRGRERTQAKKAEEAAVLAAVRAVQYEAAPGNTSRQPVRTQAPPIVVSMMTLEKPDDPAAVAKARAEYEVRRQDWNRKCDAVATTLQGTPTSVQGH